MAQLIFEEIQFITVNGEGIDESEIVSIDSPSPADNIPYWKITYLNGMVIIADPPVMIQGTLRDSALIPTAEELAV